MMLPLLSGSGVGFRGRMEGKWAFSLSEVMVAISIVAVLAIVVSQGLQKARQQSKLVGCINHLRQAGLVFRAYANDHGGAFPKSSIADATLPDPSEASHIGPYSYRMAPMTFLLEGYVTTLDAFFCPAQKVYTYPDNITIYGKSGWAAEGYHIGYILYYLRDRLSGGGSGFRNYRNARITDQGQLPMLSDISYDDPVHGDLINVLHLDGGVRQVSYRKFNEIIHWSQRIDYMMNPEGE